MLIESFKGQIAKICSIYFSKMVTRLLPRVLEVPFIFIQQSYQLHTSEWGSGAFDGGRSGEEGPFHSSAIPVGAVSDDTFEALRSSRNQ